MLKESRWQRHSKGVDFTFKVKSINCENENGNNSNEKNQSKKNIM